MEPRKEREREFHNRIRDAATDLDATRSNKKFYSIARRSRGFMENWLRSRAGKGKKLLDYACGNGVTSITASKMGFDVVGIDISDVSIENARAAGAREGIDKNFHFMVMDCEATAFPDNYFDVILVAGVLHHLDLRKAFAEMVRILKPDGEIICGEGLANNPLIHLYRKMTPHLRTAWEVDHILRVKDLGIADQYFRKVDFRFFHLFTIAAVPFRNTRLFNGLLSVLESIDSLVLRIPLLRSQAWQIIFVLSQPNKAPLN